ncbi:MAG: hypothetical protein E7613_03370 [Ruminococcaceae bacterium]|nr:hypothetical protein [Oscillospiraceae bacterium]
MENCKIFYVSPKGNDSFDGSYETPFFTVEKAYREIAKTKENVIINLLPGTYRLTETLVFDSNNTAKDKTITFKGENATIFGGEYVTDWEKHDDKIYKAHLDVEDVRNLYINTIPAKRARTKYSYSISDLLYDGDTAIGIKVLEKNFPKGFDNYRDMEFLNPWEWECHRYRIKDYRYLPESHEYAFEFDLTNIGSLKRLGKESRSFILENDMSFLDEEGEFYYNKAEKTIYYYPYEDEDITKVEATVGKKEMFVHILGDNDENRACNVTFEGIKFAGGACNIISVTGYGCYQSDAITLDYKYRSPETFTDGFFGVNTSQFRLNFADNITFKNCEFYNMGSAIIGMNDSVSNVLIEGNIFRDSSATGIRIGSPLHYHEKEGIDVCKNITVQNNVFARLPGELYNNCAISVYYEKDIKILHNYIRDVPYTAITLGWGWEGAVAYDCRNMEVAHNRIVNAMGVLRDGGGIYTLGEIKNCHVHDNVIDGVNRCGNGFSLYNDAGSAQISTYNNVVLRGVVSMYVQLTFYKTNNLNIYNNFASNPKTIIPSDNETVKWEPFIPVDENNLTGQAAEIYEKSGVEKEYKHLEKCTEFPEGHFMRTKYTWKNDFESDSDKLIGKLKGEIEAEDFMQGGEGIAFHKTFKPQRNNNPYRSEEVNLTYCYNSLSYAVHMVDVGEWLCYELDIPETDEYYIDFYVVYASMGKPLMKVYLDGELLTDNTPVTVELPNKCAMAPSGPFKMTKGKHILKLEYVTPMYFDKFRVYTGKEAPVPEELYYISDENYKDGNY